MGTIYYIVTKCLVVTKKKKKDEEQLSGEPHETIFDPSGILGAYLRILLPSRKVPPSLSFIHVAKSKPGSNTTCTEPHGPTSVHIVMILSTLRLNPNSFIFGL